MQILWHGWIGTKPVYKHTHTVNEKKANVFLLLHSIDNDIFSDMNGIHYYSQKYMDCGYACVSVCVFFHYIFYLSIHTLFTSHQTTVRPKVNHRNAQLIFVLCKYEMLCLWLYKPMCGCQCHILLIYSRYLDSTVLLLLLFFFGQFQLFSYVTICLYCWPRYFQKKRLFYASIEKEKASYRI